MTEHTAENLDLVADLAERCTNAVQAVEDQLNTDHKIDSEVDPFLTEEEIALARMVMWVVDYGAKKGLRLSQAREAITKNEAKTN